MVTYEVRREKERRRLADAGRDVETKTGAIEVVRRTNQPPSFLSSGVLTKRRNHAVARQRVPFKRKKPFQVQHKQIKGLVEDALLIKVTSCLELGERFAGLRPCSEAEKARNGRKRVGDRGNATRQQIKFQMCMPAPAPPRGDVLSTLFASASTEGRRRKCRRRSAASENANKGEKFNKSREAQVQSAWIRCERLSRLRLRSAALCSPVHACRTEGPLSVSFLLLPLSVVHHFEAQKQTTFFVCRGNEQRQPLSSSPLPTLSLLPLSLPLSLSLSLSPSGVCTPDRRRPRPRTLDSTRHNCHCFSVERKTASVSAQNSSEI
ncbi:hypothetical protein TGVEG_253050 [Toxoplasma gondii VEG]|uniref:Uncharacterized protein n=1 Tax=Toxoplasma gondii (strain ATCC 50861 / VEG) TaxID=432359 RepID=V4Z4B2_TOXGV|nr:hypothetical protein TGVEG_253050 [Toxoplasma gondii VEG]CEL72178.1 TPA: hypothetical protein BN1205_056323 [Toxoplasma gondii VEG]